MEFGTGLRQYDTQCSAARHSLFETFVPIERALGPAHRPLLLLRILLLLLLLLYFEHIGYATMRPTSNPARSLKPARCIIHPTRIFWRPLPLPRMKFFRNRLSALFGLTICKVSRAARCIGEFPSLFCRYLVVFLPPALFFPPPP